MKQPRKIKQFSTSQPTLEGAGVHLRRAFGFSKDNLFDPFLLLDDFRGDHPRQFIKGFPWHPHRGIETITYMLEGTVEHGDSLGNQGVIGAGDVQWMTAGSGIIHQEMPKGNAQGRMGGFQLWANLPAAQKMMDPRYRDITQAQIPGVTNADGVTIRIICGEALGVTGPVKDIVIDPQYLDVSIPPQTVFIHPTKAGHTVFVYVIEGQASFTPGVDALPNHTLVLYEDGESIEVTTQEVGVRFLLIAGHPLREPVAWYGPIVMNTQAELRTAFEEYQNGTFIKYR